MTNIMRRDPFAMDNVFDDVMKGFFVKPIRFANETPEMRINMDLKEDDKAYVVHAEMPGFAKEDIHVAIDGRSVSISAEAKRASERKEGEKVLCEERYHGKVYRGFSLERDIDEAAAKAKFENGVLELILPKKAEAAGKRLTVE
jgi:HSP20 family protein